MERPNTTSALKDFEKEDEYWQPSVQLRNVNRVLSSSNYHCTMGLVLQQLYVSNLGNREWRDVPAETET